MQFVSVLHNDAHKCCPWRSGNIFNIFCQWLIKPQQPGKQNVFIQCISQTRVTKSFTKANKIIHLKNWKWKEWKTITAKYLRAKCLSLSWCWQAAVCLPSVLSLFFLPLSPSPASQVKQRAGSLGVPTCRLALQFPTVFKEWLEPPHSTSLVPPRWR